MWERYKSAVRATVVASAAPYGYTLTVWTSGAVLTHAHGVPSASEALLFLLGAVAAYATVGLLAFAGSHETTIVHPPRAVVWGALHLFSVGLAIGAAYLVARLATSVVAWPVGGFVATAIYLTGSPLQLAVAHGAPIDRRQH